jgi:hypothetical protein
MKRTVVRFTLGIALVGLSAVAWANSAARLRVTIPFSFYADGRVVPAGEYIFEIGAASPGAASATSVVIRNTDGTAVAVIFTMPGWDRNMADDHLHFNRYNNTYVLSRVEGLGFQANLTMSRIEKELIGQAKGKRGSTLIAAH